MWSRIQSQMFQIALELELFEYLGKKHWTMEEISVFCKLPLPSTRVLVQYLCGSKLLKLRNQSLSNTSISQRLLVG